MTPHNRTAAQTEQEVLTLLEQGIPGRQVAFMVGVDESTVRRIKNRAGSERRLVHSDSGAEFASVEKAYKAPPVKRPDPFYSADTPNVPTSDKPYRVLAIGDLHDDPYLSKERFAWIGRHAALSNPDHIVMIGDICDLESLSFHAGNDTETGKFKPRFLADMDSLEQALTAMFEPIIDADLKSRVDLTLGNHENRIFRFEDSAPEVAGLLQKTFAQTVSAFGIKHHKYGQYVNIAGVNFTHCPFSVMGRPVGGMTAGQTIARQASGDIVYGHTHKANVITAPRLGGESKVTIIDLGCALPQGYVASYAKHTLTGWSYGIWELLIQHGSIQGYNFIPMSELERRFAD